MAEEDRALANLKVDRLVAIHVKKMGAFAVSEIERHRRFHLPNPTVDPARDAFLRPGKQRLRSVK